MFKKPKLPEVKEAPPVPTIDEAAMRDDQYRKVGRRQGRRANVLSNPTANASPGVAAKTLLG